MNGKPVILAFIGHYLPGCRSGGILRISINTIDHLCGEFDFKVVTRDRDLGDNEPYKDIKHDQWRRVGNALVYYLTPRSSGLRNITNIISNTPHHMLYLNSFFDSLTIKALLSRKLYGSTSRPVTLAPWGEFGWASLKQKFFKKLVFIIIAKIIGLYDNVIWRASSEFEKMDIIKVMKIKPDAVRVVRDLPIKNTPDLAPDPDFKLPLGRKDLRIVFLSRISREKNLDYALKVLNKVRARVTFDIYGPAEHTAYWKECQELIGQLPANITVVYKGVVNADQVLNIFSRYDLFLFPTGGEAYGHVIAESLTSGTPVLISTKTPWRDLQADGLGWDVDLMQMDSFVAIIERLALLSDDERLNNRNTIKTRIMDRLLDPVVLESNRQFFKMQPLKE